MSAAWISIKDKSPKEGQHVLIYGTGYNGGFYADAKFINGYYMLYDHYDEKYEHPCLWPSHWTPMLPPPDASDVA